MPRLLIITGPSGAGKGTLILKIRRQFGNRFSVLPVYVAGVGRGRRDHDDRIAISARRFDHLKEQNKFSYVHEYERSRYGTALPLNEPRYRNKILIWDYPGDYPDFEEKQGLEWRGLIVVPPNEFVLRTRLIRSRRGSRVCSALEEYRYARELRMDQSASAAKWAFVDSGILLSELRALRWIRNWMTNADDALQVIQTDS